MGASMSISKLPPGIKTGKKAEMKGHTDNIQDYYKYVRACECNFIPFETKEDFRTELSSPIWEVPTNMINFNGQCECGFTPGLPKSVCDDFSGYWKIKSHKMNADLAKKCNIKMAIRNHKTFPTIETLVTWMNKCDKSKIDHYFCTFLHVNKFAPTGSKSLAATVNAY